MKADHPKSLLHKYILAYILVSELLMLTMMKGISENVCARVCVIVVCLRASMCDCVFARVCMLRGVEARIHW